MFSRTEQAIKNIKSALCLLGVPQFIPKLEDHEILPLKMAIINTNKPYNTIIINGLEKAHDKKIQILASLINDCTTHKGFVSDYSLLGAKVGDETAIALADELKKNKSLKKLTFGGAEVTDKGLEALAKAIKGHPTLQELYITVGSTSLKTLVQFVMDVTQNPNILSSAFPFLTIAKNGFLYDFWQNLRGNANQSAIKFLNNTIFRELTSRNKRLKLFLSNPIEYNQLYNEWAQQWNYCWQTERYVVLKPYNINLKDILITPIPDPQSNLKSKCLFFINKNKDHPVIKKSLHLLPEELKQELAQLSVEFKN